MENFKEKLQKYADTVIKCGVNLQQNEYLVINADIENAELVRAITKSAYENGAKRVMVSWSDAEVAKLNYGYASTEALSNLFPWEAEAKNFIADIKACYIKVDSDDPDMFKNIDALKVATVNKNTRKLFDRFLDDSSANSFKWCIIGGVSKKWAEKIFPDDDNAQEKLWELIFAVNRISSDNPVEEWKKHSEALGKRCEYLNSLKLEKVVYKSLNGTDLTVKLPENYVFCGGSDLSNGCKFVANMPTEEVFSAPYKYGVNGKLVASLPLSSRGRVISNFGFTFADGKVVDFYAEEGYDTLKAILDTDEGSRYLGEIAMISFDSPINNTNTLFYNTLFDENASCHFALGSAYPSSVVGGEDMSKEELEKVGLNNSLTHVDFMVGTRDLEIIGFTSDGKEVQIMKNGNLLV